LSQGIGIALPEFTINFGDTKRRRKDSTTQQIKQEIYDAIVAQTPPDYKIPWIKIIKYSEIEKNIWLPAYYNTGGQLHKLSDYVKGSSERSLDTILKTFKSIVETGKTATFDGAFFNDTARAVIKELL
jgi:hypothetical protein